MAKLIIAVALLAALVPALAIVQCDDQNACPDNTTCCKTASGAWGCCPYKAATCCGDKTHCCPSEYPICDLEHQQCKSKTGFLTFMSTKIPATPISQVDKMAVMATIEGLLEGLGESASFKDFEPCVNDAENVIKELNEAVELFQKKTPADIKEAMTKLAETLKVLPNAMKECKAAGQEAENIVKILENFKHPVQFAYVIGKNLMVNGKDIFEEINSAIGAYKSQDWKNFGLNVGRAMTKTFLSEEQQLSSPVLTSAIVESVQKAGASWSAELNQFSKMSMADVQALLGTKLDKPLNVPVADYSHLLSYVAVPDSFDARDKWPQCIHEIRDQQRCGSCWAFGASEALSDRFCIASEGKVNVVLSPEDMVSCDSSDMGCQGGYLNKAWDYLENTGIVSDSCFPYSAGSGVAPACVDTCVDKTPFNKYKVKAGSTRSFADEASIQLEIMTNGPVETGFYVYQDFFGYKSGVYHHVSGGMAGGHAVKIIGWGVDNGEKYWTVANSWNTSWGEKGFFRIRRGTNECQIESMAIAGLPSL